MTHDVREQVVEPWLDDRRLSGGDEPHLLVIDVDADDIVPVPRETRGGDTPDVPEPEYRDPHTDLPIGTVVMSALFPGRSGSARRSRTASHHSANSPLTCGHEYFRSTSRRPARPSD